MLPPKWKEIRWSQPRESKENGNILIKTKFLPVCIESSGFTSEVAIDKRPIHSKRWKMGLEACVWGRPATADRRKKASTKSAASCYSCCCVGAATVPVACHPYTCTSPSHFHRPTLSFLLLLPDWLSFPFALWVCCWLVLCHWDSFSGPVCHVSIWHYQLIGSLLEKILSTHK